MSLLARTTWMASASGSLMSRARPADDAAGNAGSEASPSGHGSVRCLWCNAIGLSVCERSRAGEPAGAQYRAKRFAQR